MTDYSKNVTVVINSDTSELVKGLGNAKNLTEAFSGAAVEASSDLKKAFSGVSVELKEVNVELMEVQKSIKKTSDPQALQNLQKYEQELLKEKKNLDDVVAATKNVSKANKPLQLELREMTRQLALLAAAGKQNSVEFNNIAKKAGDLRNAIDDARGTIKALGSDTKYLDGMVQGVSGLVGAFSIYQGVSLLVGEDNKELQESMVKLMATMTVLNGVQEISQILQKESAFMQTVLASGMKINNFLMREKTTATVADIAATEADTVATNANTAAKTASRGVIGLIVVAVAAFAYALYKLSQQTEEQARLAEEGARNWDKYRKALDSVLESAKNGSTDIDKLTKAFESLGDKSLAKLAKQVSPFVKVWDNVNVIMNSGSKAVKEMSSEILPLTANFDKLDTKTITRLVVKLSNLKDGLKESSYEFRNGNLTYKETTAAIDNIIEGLSDQAKAYTDINKAAKEDSKTIEQLKKVYEDMTNAIAEVNLKLKENVLNQDTEWQQQWKDELAEKLKLKYLSLDDLNKADDQHKKDVSRYWQSIVDSTKEGSIANTNALLSLEDQRYREEQKEFEHNQSILDQLAKEHAKKREDILRGGFKKLFDFSDLIWSPENTKQLISTTQQLAGNVAGAISQSQQDRLNEQLSGLDDYYSAEEEKLKKNLKNNRISQEKFDKEMIVLEKKKQADILKAKREAWKKEHDSKLAMAIINTALGVTEALAEGGVAGIITGAAVAVAGGIEVGYISGQKNPYRKGTAQILNGRSHEAGGISLGQFGTAEGGEFIGITSTRATEKYGKGLLALFEGLNQSRSDKIAFGLSDISVKTGFDSHPNMSVSLAEVPEIRDIKKIMQKENTTVTYGNGYRVEKKGSITRKIYG